MCFSAIISFSAAAGLSLLGIATISRTTSKKEVLLAAFPCLFALQQALEGFVWLGKGNGNLSSIDSIATYGFLLFASLLWLVLSPLSIYCLEPELNRRLYSAEVSTFVVGTETRLLGKSRVSCSNGRNSHS